MKVIKEEDIFRIKRNLSDAGCTAQTIERFLELEQSGLRKEQYRMLVRHKLALLEKLHKEQYKIDCLDHMVYSMKKEDKKINGGL